MEETPISVFRRSNWRANSSGLAGCTGELSILSFRDGIRCASESAPGSGVRPIDCFYAGEKLPSGAELRKRRSIFQQALIPAVSKYFGKRVTRQTLHSDKRHGIGATYRGLLVGSANAVMAVDPDESSSVINGVMRAALQWAAVAKRRISVVVPEHRGQTIATRLRASPGLRQSFDSVGVGWRYPGAVALTGRGRNADPSLHPAQVEPEVAAFARSLQICCRQSLTFPEGRFPFGFEALKSPASRKMRPWYPLGEPLGPLVKRLSRQAPSHSRHPLARAHEEAWLESNLIAEIRQLLPVRQDHHFCRFRILGAKSGRSSISYGNGSRAFCR